MSRSCRHTPMAGLATADSEKADKRLANQTLRARVRARMVHCAYEGDEEYLLPELREVSDVWSMAKDGKLMFDPERRPYAMRK